jgi:hypothetical protein
VVEIGSQRHIRILLVGICLAGLTATPSRADAIDGEWCLGGSHFAIDGPSLLTPGGNRIQGAYTRHSFAYVVPQNEAGAGTEITMALLNEETVQLTRKGQTPEVWRRCKVTS